ncbi:hypothetical protein BC939DRAFT_447055 [Gamsiella multidivaricata]|uniref:uncharacterized protein n=1 Tax=Gamsiella multidivaricata TaxID=101098 RepID=UPI00222009AB|nr:uncharacterized protein BC939DRAFT_447055 [Gamsiella multidivaricata]KAI7826140.1 hypothetical protein BC939DRAFT_447055 [Gamsiella multidivaricata]
MAKTHMVSNAYKGHVKKLKAELIYKAKVKSDHAKVLKQADDNTPEFHKKVESQQPFRRGIVTASSLLLPPD